MKFFYKDRSQSLRLSYENPDIKRVYKNFYGKPLNKLSQQLLHTTYVNRSSNLGEKGMIKKNGQQQKSKHDVSSHSNKKKFRCKVCGYIYEVDTIPENYKCPVCGAGIDQFEEIS